MLEKANWASTSPAAFEKCGIYPMNRDRAMERIPHRRMKVDTENAR
jgi:hypothetical protein